MRLIAPFTFIYDLWPQKILTMTPIFSVVSRKNTPNIFLIYRRQIKSKIFFFYIWLNLL